MFLPSFLPSFVHMLGSLGLWGSNVPILLQTEHATLIVGIFVVVVQLLRISSLICISDRYMLPQGLLSTVQTLSHLSLITILQKVRATVLLPLLFYR